MNGHCTYCQAPAGGMHGFDCPLSGRVVGVQDVLEFGKALRLQTSRTPEAIEELRRMAKAAVWAEATPMELCTLGLWDMFEAALAKPRAPIEDAPRQPIVQKLHFGPGGMTGM